MIVLLDSGPLGILSNPNSSPTTLKCRYWAESRQAGKPTANPQALDGDVILAAQASLIAEATSDRFTVVATTNVGHLERFAIAKNWQDIE